MWWLAYYVTHRAPDGTVTRDRKFKSSGSEDKKVAQKLLRAELQRIGGRRPTVLDPEKVSYEDLRENFLNHCVSNGRRSLKQDADGHPTLATLPRLDKFFGGWRASEITIADLKRFRVEAHDDGIGDARCNRYMATLRAMFNRARKDELITHAEVPGYFPTVAEPNEARGFIFIKPEWYAPLLRRLKEPLRSALALSYMWGVRVHELDRIRWRHVDLKRKVVNLPGEVTKTGRPRSVPLPADFKVRPGAADDLVFPLGNYRWQWYKACVKVGAGHWEATASGRKRYVGILLRHCRHTAIRNMADAGMQLQRIKDLTGHLTDSMAHRYNIRKAEDVERARAMVEKFHRKPQRSL